jgi:hypothetical protein
MWPRRPNVHPWPVRNIHGSALTAYAQDTGIPNKIRNRLHLGHRQGFLSDLYRHHYPNFAIPPAIMPR